MTGPVLTEADLLAELQSAIDGAETSDDAFTTHELADLLGIGDAAVRLRLRRLAKTGRLVPVKIMRKSLTGNLRRVWGYRILSKPEE